MAVAVVMPRLGWTMEEGSIVEWLKRDGEPVQAGEILFTIESDKATVEVEALDSGILRIPPDSPPPGTSAPIGTVLAYLVQPGEPLPAERLASPAPPAAPTVAPAAAGAAAPGRPAISPRARRVAAELGVDWTTLTGSGRTGRVIERDVRAAAPAAQAPEPAVRITRADRQQAVEPGLPPAVPAPGPQPPTPMAGIRRLTAARLSESARTTVPVTLTTEADATRLVQLREEITADREPAGGRVPSYTDLVIRLVALALREHPHLNASLDGTTIVQHPAVQIGLAVDTERGLLVPVVRDADRRSVGQIAAETVRLIEAARAGTLAPDDLRGGTFTITNLGMYEIDAFTPVINLPECAILGLGRIVARPVVLDETAGAIAVRKLMALSLTFDHRLVDGGPAARFLQRVKHLIERPYVVLSAEC